METSCTIKTRFLIISDTHGKEFTEKNKPNQPVDVAIHCGDLTDESKTEEFKNTIQLLKDIDAPLKLAIAGNHDLTMDLPLFQRKVDEAETRSVGLELFKSVYGDPGEARTLFEDAGITFLDEGTHHFSLGNGASLTVYASPYTPRLGDWGFQFPRNQGHDFSMEKGVDVAITHGPPKGVLDNNAFGQRAGCPILFEAIARARPRIHCFGHVHEAWGAKLVTWRDLSEKPSYLTDVDNEKSTLIEGLSTLHKTKFDTPETQEMKSKKMRHYADGRSRPTSHCTGDPRPLEYGNQTLFVNAAIEGISDEHPVQLPWLVDIELSKS
ncbi:hypothetical protein FQN54_008569 [Arachnomyces sp. PD_36]|nr:hypothetical protein FQN54_008569 [Arachnomyces sp. PD_36]